MATIFRRVGMKCLGFRLTGKPSQAQIFDRMRIYDRIDARRDLSLGEVHLGTAVVGPLNWFARHRDKFRLQEPPTPLTSERHCLYVLNPQFVLPPLYWAHHLP